MFKINSCRNPSLGLTTKVKGFARVWAKRGAWECRRVWESQMNSHFGSWSPGGVPKLERVIAKVKTLLLVKFFISLEIYWSLDVQNGLAWPIWTSATQVMAKRKVGSQIAIWFPTMESWELTRFPCVQVSYDMLLESSRRGLQLQFRPCPNRRSTQEVIVPQSCGTPNFGDFRTPIWESWDKKAFKCHSRGVAQSILYGGRWWLPPSPCCGKSYESEVARGSF
jgi:hypothetical protein